MNDSYERCRSLYRAARRSESSSEADRHAVRKALAAAVTAGVTTTTVGISGAAVAGSGVYGAAASTSAAGAHGVVQVLIGGKILSSLLVGAALGTALSTTVFVAIPALRSGSSMTASSATSPGIERPRLLPSAAPVSDERGSSPRVDVPQLSNESAHQAVAPQAPASRPQLATRVRVPVASRPDSRPNRDDTLAEEAQALTEVHDALSRKDSDLAWTLLQEQDRRFPSGQLGDERAAAKVIALCAAGRYTEADLARAEFSRVYPNSPLAKRVNRGCER